MKVKIMRRKKMIRDNGMGFLDRKIYKNEELYRDVKEVEDIMKLIQLEEKEN